MITVSNLTKKFGKFTALDNISFEISKGEVFGFLGPNGAGKTTIMRILTGFFAPTAGEVRINSIDIADADNNLKAKRTIGYLAENNPIYNEMKVVEYLLFIARVKGSKDVEGEAERVIKLCSLSERKGQLISELSKGLKQRVGLAAALIGDPEILILDEPTNGLDPNQIVEIRNLIKEIGKEKTIILSTHILPEVKESCTRVMVINRGHIVAQGSVEELTAMSAAKEALEVLVKGENEKSIEEGLSKIANVDKVKAVGNRDGAYAFEIETTKGFDLRESLFRAACDNHWVILEMQKKSVSLEEVFKELTK